MKPERRTARSEDPSTALGLYLRSVSRKGALEAAVVCDDAGLLIAGSAEKKVDLEALAAVGPLKGAKHEGRPVHRKSYDIGGTVLWFVALGPQAPEAKDLGQALGRILSLDAA
ncbi:MAG: hypothetical protein U1E65_28280 [Myxococcota bacterium]